MKQIYKRTLSALSLVLMFLVIHPPVSLACLDFMTDRWTFLIRDTTAPAEKGSVEYLGIDYKKIAQDERLMEVIEHVSEMGPMGDSPADEAAFWINSYNIFAIKMIVDNKETKGIKNIGSFISPVWKKPAGNVAGTVYSLDDIKDNILRKLGDPRIHAALVRASVSCPDIARFTYRGQDLNYQLDEQVTLFLKNRTKGLKINDKTKTIYISKIFKWYESDFKSSGGVRKFISGYLSPKDAAKVLDKSYKIKYFKYNWSLNSI